MPFIKRNFGPCASARLNKLCGKKTKKKKIAKMKIGFMVSVKLFWVQLEKLN